MERDFCNKCGACCNNIPVDFGRKIMYRDGIQPLGDKFEEFLQPVSTKENITFCTCKYLKDNLCVNPEKPEICKVFPYSPLAFLPEGCGFEGEIFLKKEHLMQKIRRLKEEILDYNVQIETTRDKSEQRQLQRIVQAHQAFIDKYKAYGSADW